MMLEFRKKYLELNNIPCKKDWVIAGEYLTENPNSNIRGEHKYINLIKEFKKLINKKIEIELFFSIGDGFSKFKYISDKHSIKDGIKLIEKHKDIKPNTLVIITKKAAQFIQTSKLQDRKTTVKSLQQKKCLLLEIENV